jgi:PAS domain S-box-containing protein
MIDAQPAMRRGLCRGSCRSTEDSSLSIGGIQQLLTLPPAPDSARAARRFVGEVLSAAGAEPFGETAALLTSELVTNGIVHAHTDLQVRVEATRRWVRVEVVDGNPHLPSRRDYDEQASTGRGLEMIEQLADDFGVQPLDGRGKLVWFRLGAVPGTPPVAPEPRSPSEPSGAKLPDMVTLRLRNLPVALYCAWQQHAEALLRDATLAAFDSAAPDGNGDYPLASQALGTLADSAHEIFDLRERDVATADIDLDLDRESTGWFPILRDLLRRATNMAVAGRLLVPPSLPEIVALRNWLCDEVARQSAGLQPTAWSPLSLDEKAPAKVSPSALARVASATAALVAADVANRIVAVSPAAAELLGWQPRQLVGRRLVTIIPARLRDRHVAGFTRHLVDGTSRILGTMIRVPALRADGSEIEISLVIERLEDPDSRGLFVATLTAA